MHVSKIAEHEADFDQRGVDSHGKFHTLTQQEIAIPGESGRLKYVRVKPASGDASYYFASPQTKEQVVLHFTMGYLKGDVATLTTPDYHVSVPFVVGRNGTVYNLFPSAHWAYHLGPGAVGGNAARSRATIGIELSNIGPLRRLGDRMATYYSDADTYCGADDAASCRRAPYRRFEHYATFTDAQYASLVTLLRYLTARYDIPRAILPENRRYDADADVVPFRGVVSHVNYRPSGKEDIGPGFDWDRLASGLQA